MDDKLEFGESVICLTGNRVSGTIDIRENESRKAHGNLISSVVSESELMVSDNTKPPGQNGVDRQMKNFAQLVLSDLLHQVPSEKRSRVRQTAEWMSNQVVSRNYDQIGVIDALTRRGCSRELVIDFCIPMAARILGDEWARDLRNFAQVTLGTARLGEILKELGLSTRDCPGQDGGAILLVACRGEQHILGAQVLADQLCRRKQQVKLIVDATWQDVLKLCQTGDFSALMFTCAGIHALPALTDSVNKVRHFFGADLPIVIGGQMLEIDAEKLSCLPVNLVSNDLDVVLSVLELVSISAKDNIQTEG
mgnify:CR=1 FL=1